MGSTTVQGRPGAREGARTGLVSGLRRWRAGLADVSVVLIAAGIAYLAHTAYCERLPVRWSSIYHDRNAHYQAGLNVAAELRNGHLLQAVLDLDAASVAWPGLHPTLLAGVLTVAGLRPTVAVLPSLLGWVLAVVLAFDLARRLGGPWGVFGGWITALFFLSSPALQALATDVMLESLGLALTLACVAAYLTFCERPTRLTGAVLGGLLALLFLHKYNYGGLVALSLAIAELARRPRAVLGCVHRAFAAVPWRSWAWNQLRRPLNYPIALLLGISALAVCRGGLSLEIGGFRWEIRETRLYVHAAYALGLIRLAAWWATAGRATLTHLIGAPAVTLLSWAGVPILLWFLLPFRLQYFLWYAGPGNAPPGLSHSFTEAVRYYGGGFVSDYHTAPAFALLAAALAGVGLLALVGRRSTPSGWAAVPLVFSVCGLLTLLHPNQQLRFLHTWAPLLWVLAGIGWAAALDGLNRLPGLSRASDRGRLIRRCAIPTAGTLLVLGFAVALIITTPRFANVGRGFGRGYDPDDVSLRELYEAYLSRIDGGRPTALFTNLPDASWRWPFIERFGHKNRLKHNMRDVGAFDPVDADGARRWLATCESVTLVYLEIPPGSPLFEPTVYTRTNDAILEALRTQSRFDLDERIDVGYLGTVWIWKRPDESTTLAARVD